MNSTAGPVAGSAPYGEKKKNTKQHVFREARTDENTCSQLLPRDLLICSGSCFFLTFCTAWKPRAKCQLNSSSSKLSVTGVEDVAFTVPDTKPKKCTKTQKAPHRAQRLVQPAACLPGYPRGH